MRNNAVALFFLKQHIFQNMQTYFGVLEKHHVVKKLKPLL